jgi:CspA family cold shock protein
MPQGTIKKLVADRGFGFISVGDRGGDVFFHLTSVVGVNYEELREGQPVEYELEQSGGKGDRGKGPRASSVKPL